MRSRKLLPLICAAALVFGTLAGMLLVLWRGAVIKPKGADGELKLPSAYLTPSEKIEKEDLRININKASAEELTELPGIGEKTAERIIEYRETYGVFQSIEEITAVSGIGAATFEKIKDLITI